MRGIGQHAVDAAELLAARVVEYRQPHELLVEVLALGQPGILTADGDDFPLQGEGGIHIRHAGQREQDDGLVDAAREHAHRLARDIECVKRGEKAGVAALGVQLDLAADTVGVDDPAHGNKFRTHGFRSFWRKFPIYYTGNLPVMQEVITLFSFVSRQ